MNYRIFASSKLISLLSIIIILHINFTSLTSQNIWIGGIGDWDNPLNWSAGTLPTFSDTVKIITVGDNVTIPAPHNARALQVILAQRTSLTIENKSRLNLLNGNLGIQNEGEVQCEGTINMRKPDAIGVENFSNANFAISTSGIVNIDTTGDTGIKNYGTLINEGLIDIDSAVVDCIYNGSGASFNNEGVISAQRFGERGVQNESTSTFTNVGEIFAQNAVGFGISNNGAFTNEGEITIQNITGSDGILNSGNLALFSNTGLLNLANIGGNGIEVVAQGNVSNSGTIVIASIIEDGMGISLNSSMLNDTMGTINITEIGERGVSNANNLINNGYLSIEDTGSSGLYNQGLLMNEGELVIIQTIGDGIFNFDSIYNGQMGVMRISQVNESGRVGIDNFVEEDAITNDGSIFIDSVTAGITGDRIINNGKLSIKNVTNSAIATYGMINTDTIIIDNVDIGINIDAISSDTVFTNHINGVVLVSNVDEGIYLQNGFLSNHGSISLDIAANAGVDMLISNSSLETLLMNHTGAEILITNAGAYGMRVRSDSKVVQLANALIQISNTTGTPLEIENGAIVDGEHLITID